MWNVFPYCCVSQKIKLNKTQSQNKTRKDWKIDKMTDDLFAISILWGILYQYNTKMIIIEILIN